MVLGAAASETPYVMDGVTSAVHVDLQVDLAGGSS